MIVVAEVLWLVRWAFEIKPQARVMGGKDVFYFPSGVYFVRTLVVIPIEEGMISACST